MVQVRSTASVVRPFVTTLLGLVLVGCSEGGSAVEPAAVYQPPDMSKFIMSSENDADGDGDGVKETHVRHYKNLAGDKVFSMTAKDRLWAWSLESRGADGKDLTRNYVIRDSNCDGVFDERYGLDEEFRVPEWLK